MSSTRSTVIRTDDLRKEYGETVAVDDLSLEIYENEIFALLGPNGAGKTTTIELLQGLRTPTSGAATVLGLDLSTNLYALKERIGVVPQSFHTFERLTVRENVALIHDLHADPIAVDVVIDELGLGAYADTRFAALSGGYQRRTGIAMALVSDPDVLFLDEPTTGLDPAARRATWDQIAGLPAMGTTVVLTSHDMDEVAYLADRVGLLVEGAMEAVDTVPGLIDRYAGEVKVVVHRHGEVDVAVGAALQTTLEEAAQSTYTTDDGDLVGVFDDRQQAQAVYGRLHDRGSGQSIDLVSPDMEDVFLALAGRTLGPGGELQ